MHWYLKQIVAVSVIPSETVICTDWKFQVKLSFVPIGWPFTVQGAPIPILGERPKMSENLLSGM